MYLKTLFEVLRPLYDIDRVFVVTLQLRHLSTNPYDKPKALQALSRRA